MIHACRRECEFGGWFDSTRIRWRNLEAAYEVFKAWVVVQRIESWVDFDQAKNAFAVLISPIQLDKFLITLAERRVERGYIVRS